MKCIPFVHKDCKIHMQRADMLYLSTTCTHLKLG
jgi:hypothetical protein